MTGPRRWSGSGGLGYEILEEGFDTFCLDPVDDDLTKRFRRLRPAVAPVSVHDE